MMTTISSERPGALWTAMECVIAVTVTDLLNRFNPPPGLTGLTGHVNCSNDGILAIQEFSPTLTEYCTLHCTALKDQHKYCVDVG